MSQTSQYLETLSASQAIEVGSLVDAIILDAILKKMPTRDLQQIAIDQGMQNLWQNGLRRALSGQTTLEEILRVIAIDQL